MRKTRYFIIAITLITFLFPNCRGKSGRKEGPTIITKGKSVRIAKETIDSYGGQIIVAKPGDPLDGLTIDIPENAFEDETTLRISYEKISDHKLGKLFNPVTPLISIDNGGDYANEPMILTIPVNVKQDEFAMAFYYNTKTGRLEGMPLLASDEEKVVVATRRFGTASDNYGNSGLAAQANTSNREEQEKIVVTVAKEKDLRGNYTSGFIPGRDDFPTENYGSTLANKGHCAGQSISMLWYYCEKKLNGEPSLHRLLENNGGPATPRFWHDDVSAIKWASIMQYEFSIGLPFRAVALGVQLFGQLALPDRVTMNAFTYAIRLTNEPQLIGINQNDLTDAGHAMVVYKVSPAALYVADPNRPGVKDLTIEFDEDRGKFLPFISGATARDKNTRFTRFFYVAKSSFFSWPKAAKHWTEVEDKTIGDSKYPEYELVAQDENVEYVLLKDGFKIVDGRLNINIRGGKFTAAVYDSHGKSIYTEDGMNFQIPEGEDKIGVEVLDEGGNWVGYKWIKVKVGKDRSMPHSDERPTYGVVYVDMEVNGKNFPVDTTQFHLSMSSKFFALRAYGFKPTETDEDYLRDHLLIEVNNCNGVGTYNNAVATWTEDAVNGFHFKGTGRLEITRWAAGALNGSFSFTVTETNPYYGEAKVRTISGSFRYKGKVWED